MQVRQLLLVVLVMTLGRDVTGSRPHIVILMADDLGWNDVNFRQGAASDMYTPNINRLSKEGVNMPNAYMMQMCTPSRSALLTGIYPFRYGMQHYVLEALNNGSMPLNKKVFPERLKELGYKNYLVGKWHLGFCNPAMTPTGRGFDYFYGMYNGEADYFNHTSKWAGYDMTEETVTATGTNRRAVWEGEGIYSTDLFTDKAIEIIQNHNKAQPLFLWLSYQAVHGPLEVPQSYVDNYCSNVATSADNGRRQLKCAMTAAMDEGMGKVRAALDANGYSDNLVTLFMSDNGGPTSQGSSNDPLRGSKVTLWEGGVRAVTVLHSKKYFPAQYNANNSASWNGIMHAVDWYPTLAKAAEDTTPVSNIDGFNNWNNILTNSSSAREWMLVNINDVKGDCAIRYGDFKLHRDGVLPAVGADDTGLSPSYKLYDLKNDISESTNLKNKADKQTILQTMKNKLFQLMNERYPAKQYSDVEGGKPRYWDGTWSTGWC